MPAYKLDHYDIRIIDILQHDGRITKVKLADAVHLSPSSTWERLRRLEEAGVIKGYRAQIDTEKIISTTTVMVEITLERHGLEDCKRFEEAVVNMPEVTACWGIGGGLDYMMQVVAADMSTYQHLMDSLLESGVGIDRYISYFVTKPVKKVTEPSVIALADEITATGVPHR